MTTRRPVSSEHDLKEAVASEIIARLFLVHKIPEETGGSSVLLRRDENFVPPLNEIERHRFLALIRRGDLERANHLVDELVTRGLSARELLISLLGGAAERLGELWEQDEADFAEVTIALCNLHRLLRERNWSPGQKETGPLNGLSLLMTTFSGEQHIFGAMIVAEIFRRKGWGVTTLAGEPHAKVCAALRASRYDVLGISAAAIHDEAGAASEIAAFRAASRNPDLKVVVGGRAFAQEVELCSRIGADAMAEDAEEAPDCRPGCS